MSLFFGGCAMGLLALLFLLLKPRRWAVSGLFALGLLAAPGAQAQAVLFSDQPAPRTNAQQQPMANPPRARSLAVNLTAVRNVLRQAPAAIGQGPTAGVVLALPLPEGGSQRYRVRRTQVMAPTLAARFPQIQTYEAQGLDDPAATARLDLGPGGLHAQVLSAGRALYLDPAGDSAHAVVYDQPAAHPTATWTCQTAAGTGPATTASTAGQANGALLRTYRLAVACTPEYCLTQGNTTASVLAAVVTSINRIDGVYEREMAVRLVLVAQEDQLLFLSGTGPTASPAYSNSNGTAMLTQNQTNLDRLVGDANYDLGHVFSTGGSGIAYVGSACASGLKAGGVSGQANPTGDGFDIDYVTHEIGHQLGGTHTFNGYFGDCAGASRTAASAYEPGSGITVMAYAGICAPENIAANSIPYFHSRSYDELLAFVAAGGTCAVATPTGNQPPVPAAGPQYRIPIGTPFRLTGSATDPDGDALTYSWEEFDRNATLTPIGSPAGDAPIFRPFAPSTSPTRVFPQLSDVVNNTQTIGELLPTYGRRLHFRFVARDNRLGGGGVDYDSTSVAVIGSAGPFRVQLPNAGTEQWARGSSVSVAWEVANTAGAPINATQVDILLSTDGGYTYPTVLLAGAPNTGTATVLVPAGAPLTTQARVMVQATGNVFFDISDQNFSIITALAALPSATAAGVSVYPNPATGLFTLAVANGQRGPVALHVLDALGRPVGNFQGVKTTDAWQFAFDLSALASGVYFLQVALPAGTVVQRLLKQ